MQHDWGEVELVSQIISVTKKWGRTLKQQRQPRQRESWWASLGAEFMEARSLLRINASIDDAGLLRKISHFLEAGFQGPLYLRTSHVLLSRALSLALRRFGGHILGSGGEGKSTKDLGPSLDSWSILAQTGDKAVLFLLRSAKEVAGLIGTTCHRELLGIDLGSTAGC